MVEIKEGLKPLPEDNRDLRLGSVFGQGDPKKLPVYSFKVCNPLVIKDQRNSDFCSAYGLTAVSEDQEGIELSPFYQFAKTCQIMGEWDTWGADLRSACKSSIKYGSLSDEMPTNIAKDPFNKSLSADWTNWPSRFDYYAKKHRKRSYFRVDGGYYDTFDNVRLALWEGRSKKQSVLTGCKWRPEWLSAPGGIIPKEYSDRGFGHAFKIFGQKPIGNTMYLMCQLSSGDRVGDKGIFYMPREVANRELTYGCFQFRDLDPKVAKKIQSSTGTLKDYPGTRFLLWLWGLFR